MGHMCRTLQAGAFLLCLAAVVQADDSLPAETVQRLKDGTVYIKTEIGPLSMTGSGFVIQVTGNTALVVTNQHVISKPKELRAGSFVPGLRGRDRIALMRIQQALAAAQPVATVVFNSGNANEQAILAEMLGGLEDPDLAILKVTGIKMPPRPIDLREAAQPVETLPVYMLGFPFGDALATNKGNPTITIGKGSVSSIRKDAAGKLARVQIDGALNPGNSGGPVVDAKGYLVGIAVQTIQGSNIGLAIPPAELSSLLEGRIGTPTVVVGAVETGAAPTYEILVPVVDPLKKLKSISVQFVDGAIAIDTTKAGQPQLQSIPGTQKIDLALADRTARAKLPLAASADQKVRELTVQASFVNQAGQAVHLDPQVLKVQPPQTLTTTVTKNGKSTTVTQTMKTAKGGTIRREVTVNRGGSSPSKMSALKDDNADDDADDEVDDKKSKGKKEKTKGSKPTEEKDSDKASEVGWTNRITKMKKIPDDEVTGKIDGIEFTLDKVSITGGRLVFRKGTGFFAKAEMDIVLFTRPNDDLSGKKIVVNGNVRAGQPHVTIQTMRKGQKIPDTQAHLDYLMVLEFGDYDAESRVQPGKIYICLPDRGKSFLAGSFEAAID